MSSTGLGPEKIKVKTSRANPGIDGLKDSTVGERIRFIRTSMGLTQDQLAERASISKSFLSEIENNKTRASGHNLLRIADTLNTSLDFLMKGEAQRETSETQNIQIPGPLAKMAEEHGLSYKSVMTLLGAHNQFIARRSPEREREWSKRDWIEFYEKVKSYL